MAHNITERDNLFSVRLPAWHGLGVVLPEYPTRDEAKAIAHPWEPISQPIFRRVLNPDLTEGYEEITTHQGVQRSDDGGMLGIVTSTYTPINNAELYDVAEAIQGEGQEIKFETGGSLLGGSKVWLLLRLNDPIEIKGDKLGASIAYYALQNAHDGSGSFRGQGTMTRIVCDNTAQMADLDAKARGTEFTFRHTSNVKDRIEEAKLALAGWRAGLANWSEQMEWLLEQPVTAKQQDWFIKTFIPAPPSGHASLRVINNVDQARTDFRSILVGDTMDEAVAHTAYGLVQTSIEWSQHYRATRAQTIEGRMESLFRRAYLDRSKYTQGAVEVARTALSVS